MKITTSFDYPPIPIRNYDWSAIDSNAYDGEGSLIGHGATEQDAIADLLGQMKESCLLCEVSIPQPSDPTGQNAPICNSANDVQVVDGVPMCAGCRESQGVK